MRATLYRITEDDAGLILLLNLQGVVNRDAPRLFLDAEGRTDWGPADRRWVELYSETKGIAFEPAESLDDLIAEFRQWLGGLVVFDPELDASRYVALTLAGLTGCLAVSPDQVQGEIARLPVSEDLRGRFGSGSEAYEWALGNLRPRCSDEIVFSAGQSHDDVNLGHDKGIILALDYAIARRAFIFNLSPCAEAATYDFEKETVKGHPEDVELMERIFASYAPPAKVYGWNEPEWPFTSRVSKHGHMLLCGRASNLSFHAQVHSEFPPTTRGPVLSPAEGRVRERVESPIEPKYYLAFMTNEGDTPRVFTTFFFGAWENPERGEVPINWGINPTLVCDFAAIAEYYYSTATPNDCFFAGVSGPGYAFIDQLPDVGSFARYAKPRFEAAGIGIVDAWDEFELDPARYEEYARGAGVRLFTVLPRGEPGVKTLPSGLPVIVPDARVHYKDSDVDSRLANIKAIASEHEPPYLIPLYGGLRKDSCARFKRIAEALDPARFEFVTLDRMARLACEARQEELR